MKTSDIKTKWNQFRNQMGYVQRIDPNHPMDLFIGISDKGYEELVLFTSIEPALIKSSQAIEISKNKRVKDDKWATQICLKDHNNQDIFARLCIDLVESSQNVKTEQEGIDCISRRFLAWQKLFATIQVGLPKHVLKGLVGELYFAIDVLSRYYDWDDIITAWLGPDGADRDYVFYDKWFEIKAVATGKETISISSLDQLEIDRTGYIAKYNVDDSSETDSAAISVSSIVNSFRSLISSSPNAAQLFEQKLVSLGYIDRTEYDSVCFVCKGPSYYMIDDSFPRLTRSIVPIEIVEAQYELSIVGIEPWRKEESQIWI